MKKLNEIEIGTKITIGNRKVPYELKERNERYLICTGKRFNEPDHIVFDLEEKTMGLVLDYRERNTINNPKFAQILLRLLINKDVEIIEKSKRFISKEKIVINGEGE